MPVLTVERKRVAASASSSATAGALPEQIVETLATFDRGNGDKKILEARLKRSRIKVAEGELLSETPRQVDDSLLMDSVGATTRTYERHAQYTGVLRVPAAAADKGKEEDDEECEPMDVEDIDGDDDEVEVEEGEAEPLYEGDVFMDDADNDCHLLIANQQEMAEPDVEGAQRIDSFQEYATPDPAAKQFEHNMRHIKGREQNIFVEVDSDDIRYQHVSDTLMAPLRNQQFLTFTMENGIKIPRLPRMSKAEIQAARCAPDFSMGERPCVRGIQCASFIEATKRKAQEPEKYAGLEPFPCKEFYFGPHGDRMREAIAAGYDPSEVMNAMPVMCVMCHEDVVTEYYKKYDMGVMRKDVPVHILHAYQVLPNEYPPTVLLLGSKRFRGVIAPYIRYCPDNYEWIPEHPSTVGATAAGGKGQVSVVQRWTEKPCMDFR